MFEITLNHNTNLTVINAVAIYAFKIHSSTAKYLKGVFDHRINIRHSDVLKNLTFEDLNKKFFLSIPYGGLDIEFNKTIINLHRILIGKPKCDEGRIFINENIILRTDSSMKVLLDFIRIALVFYKETIMDVKTDNKKVVCWLMDEGMWDKLNSHSPRDLSTIYLEQEKKDKIINDIKKFQHKDTIERYSYLGIRYKRNYLFAGYPGTGKSSLAYALASTLKMDISIINFGQSVTDAVLSRSLKYVPKNSILLLEDIDALFKERKTDDFKNMISFSGMLNCLDGICFKEGLITIMTTNYKNKLDPALNRPGRIDYIMDFGYSTKAEIKMMYEKYYPKPMHSFEKFYKKIRNSKLTMATIQGYFLEHMTDDKLIEDIDILTKRADEYKYDDSNVSFYT